MPLITCKECGSEVSSTAKTCPKCGARVKPPSKAWMWIIGTPIGLFALMMIWSASTPEYKHRARELRKVCEQMLGPMNAHRYRECDAIYDNTMREGRAAEEAAKR